MVCGVTCGCQLDMTSDSWGGDDYDSYDSNDYEPPEPIYEPPPDTCRPSEAAWDEMRRIHDDTELSVHELIKCGGLQTSLSRTFVVVVIASNRQLFDEDAYARLVDIAGNYGIDLTVPFSPEDGGRWSTPIRGLGDSSFTLTFRDPTTGAVIEENPFIIDTYLTGVVGEAEHTIERMEANVSLKNRITFTWEARGPLAHLMSRRAPVPNPFDIHVSLSDVYAWTSGFSFTPATPDFGPIEGVLDLEVESEIAFTDQIGRTDIEYTVFGERSSLREIMARGVGFQVEAIESRRNDVSIRGSATRLRYDGGTLRGRFDYHVSSPTGALMVSDTYGDRGLEVRWSCAPSSD
jgi:hypothetical protein